MMMADGGWVSRAGDKRDGAVTVNDGIEWLARAKSLIRNSTKSSIS